MSRSFNKVLVLGNLGNVPEMRYTPDGKAVTTFSVATNRSWKNKAGNTEEEVTWFRVTVWELQAETCNKILNKGDSVFVEGRMHASAWEKDGVKHDGMEVIASNVIFLTPKREAPAAPAPPAKSERQSYVEKTLAELQKDSVEVAGVDESEAVSDTVAG